MGGQGDQSMLLRDDSVRVATAAGSCSGDHAGAPVCGAHQRSTQASLVLELVWASAVVQSTIQAQGTSGTAKHVAAVVWHYKWPVDLISDTASFLMHYAG